MKTYIICYQGAVEIEALDEEQAEDFAWVNEAIRQEDIISVTEKHD